MSGSLVVFGTGESLDRYKEHIPALINKMDSLAWGKTLEFIVRTHKIYPRYYSYIDPSSAVSSLQILKKIKRKTELLILDPIVNTSLSEFKSNLGSTALGREGHISFGDYLHLLRVSLARNPHRFFSCITLKKLLLDGNPLYNRDLDDKEANLRFEQEFIVAGMKDKMGRLTDKHTRIMNLYENKLTMIILPLCAKLGYNTIYLLGFDGVGGRYFDRKLKNSIVNATYEAFLPRWTTNWMGFHDMGIVNLVPEPYSILNKWLPYQDIKGLLN